MAINDDPNFSLEDIRAELGGTPKPYTLKTAFVESDPAQFDPAYSAADERMSRFRNYGVVAVCCSPVLDSVTDFGSTQVSINWSFGTCDVSVSAVTVQSSVDGINWPSSSTGSPASPRILTRPTAKRYYRVLSNCSGGLTSEPSNIVEYNPPSVPDPAGPIDFYVTSIETKKAAFNFEAFSTTTTNQIITVKYTLVILVGTRVQLNYPGFTQNFTTNGQSVNINLQLPHDSILTTEFTLVGDAGSYATFKAEVIYVEDDELPTVASLSHSVQIASETVLIKEGWATDDLVVTRVSGDAPWVNQANIKFAPDQTRAVSTLYNNGTLYSNYIYGYAFNLGVPSTANIVGVEFIVVASTQSFNYVVRLEEARLMTSSAVAPAATKNTVANITKDSREHSVGGPTDLWGLGSIAPVEVNNNISGIQLSFYNFGSTNGSFSVHVDAIKMKVYYTNDSPP